MKANSHVRELDGGDALETSHTWRTTPATTVIACGGLFSFIGADPASAWLSGCAALDDHGFVLTDRATHQRATWTARWETPRPHAAPVLRPATRASSPSVKFARVGPDRVTAAVGEGSAAVRSVHDYLAFAT